jgi:hypothetical protein
VNYSRCSLVSHDSPYQLLSSSAVSQAQATSSSLVFGMNGAGLSCETSCHDSDRWQFTVKHSASGSKHWCLARQSAQITIELNVLKLYQEGILGAGTLTVWSLNSVSIQELCYSIQLYGNYMGYNIFLYRSMLITYRYIYTGYIYTGSLHTKSIYTGSGHLIASIY